MPEKSRLRAVQRNEPCIGPISAATPEASTYLDRTAAERHLAKRVIRRMWQDEQARTGLQIIAA